MKFKLPESKRDRTMVVVMMVVAAMATVYLVGRQILNPIVNSWNKISEKQIALQKELGQAQIEVKKLPQTRIAYARMNSDILDMSRKYVIHSALGAYSLVAEAKLENVAQDCGMKVEGFKELGVSDLPGKKERKERPFKAYGAELTGLASYAAVFNMIRTLEEENPLLNVSGISVQTRPGDPEVHKVTLSVQWPVWTSLALEPTEAETRAPAHTNGENQLKN